MYNQFLGWANPFLEYLQSVVRTMYGKPGMWGRGRHEHGTKKGPGRRRIHTMPHPAGTKLVRRFIRDSKGENTPMRLEYLHRTNKNMGEAA